MKAFWLSRTFWVNFIAFVAFAVEEATGNMVISPEIQAMILGALNLVLRFRTNEGVGL